MVDSWYPWSDDDNNDNIWCSGGDRATEPAARTGSGHQGDWRGRGAAVHRPARRPRRAPHRHVGPCLVTSHSHLSSVLRLLVLISIRRGLVKLKREVTRLLSLISGPSLIIEEKVTLLWSSSTPWPAQAATWSATASAAAAARRGTGAGARPTTRTSSSTGRAKLGFIMGQ